MSSASRVRRRMLAVAANVLIVAFSLCAAFLLRFDFLIGADQRELMIYGCLLAVVVKSMVFSVTGVFNGWNRHAGVDDAWRIIVAGFLASTAFVFVCWVTFGARFPRSVYLIDLLLSTGLVGALRFQLRLFHDVIRRNWSKSRKTGVLIYGAGVAGHALSRQLRASTVVEYDPVGFLDDDLDKEGSTELGLPVLGPGEDAPRLIEELAARGVIIEQIIIAMPSATAQQMSLAVENCRAAGVRCKTIPSLSELIDGNAQLANRVRDISVVDLLGRSPIHLNSEQIRHEYCGKNVLVTGAAGSIGSEICRQVLRLQPGRLVMLDHAESDLYRIDLELRQRHPEADLRPCVGTVRERRRLDAVLSENQIDVVLHAAAYKHVPLMEAHPLEVVMTNVMGTCNLMEAASAYGVETFVLISSDKAVNPTNLMGLTKRVAELLIGGMESAAKNRTKFVSVRFGNVLGSNGSVFPLFQSQISSGGPVTVTDPEVRRFFMTISEAVQLVLQASAMGHRSEVFVLNMGELIRIDDLARQMIRLAGLVPDQDIKIKYVGLRPGEKLYEEVITQGENVQPTHHEKIKIFRGPSHSYQDMMSWVVDMEQLLAASDQAGVVAHLASIVPEYRPGGEWKSACEKVARLRAVEFAAAGD